MDELQAKIAAARARKQAAEAALDEMQARDAGAAELEAVERDAADAEAILKAKSEHGAARIACVATDMGVIILKRPHVAHFKKFQDLEAFKVADVERLVRPCVVHPPADTLDRILDEFPGVLAACAERVAYLAGVRRNDLAAK
jgi:hypothetical protein